MHQLVQGNEWRKDYKTELKWSVVGHAYSLSSLKIAWRINIL